MIDVLGWLGSILVVTSLIQRDLRRLRQVNLAASIALGVFNIVLGIWPMIVLNVVLAVVNGWHLYVASRPVDHSDGRTDRAETAQRDTAATDFERHRASVSRHGAVHAFR